MYYLLWSWVSFKFLDVFICVSMRSPCVDADSSSIRAATRQESHVDTDFLSSSVFLLFMTLVLVIPICQG